MYYTTRKRKYQCNQCTALYCRVTIRWTWTFMAFKVHWLTIPKLLKQIYFCNLPNILYLSILVTLSFPGWKGLNQNNQDKWNACGYPHALTTYACSESLRNKGCGQPLWSREIGILHERLTSLFLWYPKGESPKTPGESFRRQSLREHTCVCICLYMSSYGTLLPLQQY